MAAIIYDHIVGHDWNHGFRDCLEVIREFYQANFPQVPPIPNYARPDKWWDHGLDLYRTFGKKLGFEEKDHTSAQVQIGDILLMAIKSEVPNHGAIWIGNGQILHHLPFRRSEVGPYRGALRTCTVGLLRHPTVTFERPVIRVDFRDLPSFLGVGDGRVSSGTAEAISGG